MKHLHQHRELDLKLGHSEFAGKKDGINSLVVTGNLLKSAKFKSKLSFYIKKERLDLQHYS